MTSSVPLPVVRIEPSAATLMIKPVGGLCNLRCGYCYYLPTLDMYEGRVRRMSLDTLEAVFAGWLPRAADNVTIAWQGGEPTLAGLDFFQRMVEVQQRYQRAGQQVRHALQTNGTLLNEPWCAFFREHGFLVGISIDGGRQMHDFYRVDARGGGTFQAVRRGLKLLRGHGVEHNVLCVLTDRSVKHPRAVWQAMLSLDEAWLQFIPAIEWEPDERGGYRLAPFSPRGEDYGRFLCEVFDLWFEGAREQVSVRDFDTWLGVLVTGRSALCQFAPSCHSQITVEHNGDVYGCDHFVQRAWLLGRAEGGPAPGDAGAWFDGLDGVRLGTFAAMKANLCEACRACEWLGLCYGGCTKHRARRGAAAEPSVLCEGYRMFFEHAMLRLQWLAGGLRWGGS